jgi:hypothetical protein
MQQEGTKAMTTKIALIASVMLLGLSGAAVAGSARVPLHGSAAPASRQSADPFKSFDSAALTTSAKPNAYRYHGGPKSNY